MRLWIAEGLRSKKVRAQTTEDCVEFKGQVVAEYAAGESEHVVGWRYDLSRNPRRIWVEKAGTGELDNDREAARLAWGPRVAIAPLADEAQLGKEVRHESDRSRPPSAHRT